MLVLDIDGVLADTNSSLHDYVGGTLNVHRDGEATEYHGLHLVYPVDLQDAAEELIKLAFRYDAGGVYSRAKPFEGAVRAANWANEQGILIGYVTRRPPRVALQTVKWLRDWGFPDLPVKFHDGTPHKGYAMRALGARVIIEDSPKEAKALYDAGMKVILVDRVYNTMAPKKIERAITLGDAVFWAREWLDGYKTLVEANERLGKYEVNV